MSEILTFPGISYMSVKVKLSSSLLVDHLTLADILYTHSFYVSASPFATTKVSFSIPFA